MDGLCRRLSQAYKQRRAKANDADGGNQFREMVSL